jgi:hypothetical protein
MALKGKTSGSGFRYKERASDSVKKRAEQDSGAFDSIFKSGIDTWRAKNGDNLIRFIPPTWADPDHYGFDVWVHSYIGADSGSYLCPAKMKNKPCPICDAQKEAADAGEEDEARALKASKKVAAWVIDRDDDKPIPKIYLMSWTMDRDIAALCHNKRTGKVLMIDNPEQGYDVTIKRSGQKLNTRYFGMAIDRDPSEMLDSQKEINKIMAYVEENPIPETLAFKDAKYLAAVVEGSASKKDADEEEDEKPRRRSRKREEDEEDEAPVKKRKRAEPEEDEEEDEAPPKKRKRVVEEDDEEEDEPAPKKRKRADPDEDEEDEPAPKKRKRVEPEEEDEEEEPAPRKRKRADPDEDEEEDEPAPKKRKRAEPEEDEEEEDEPAPKKRKRVRIEEDEEEEDEPAPKKRKRADPDEDEEEEAPPKKRRRAEPEEDEEEEDEEPEEEEEEDEPAPRKRRR